MIQKIKRKEDPMLLESYRKMPCAVQDAHNGGNAYHYGPVAGHHIKTRGSGGHDEASNLIPLCTWHHTGSPGIHVFGIPKFVEAWRLEPSALVKLKAYLSYRGKASVTS